MSDDPFAAFKEGQPPAQSEAAPDKSAKNGRKKRKIPPKKLTPTVPPIADTPKPAKKERKARKPRQPGQRRPVMIPISMLPELGGLSDEDASRLMSFISNMHDLPKKSRRRIAEIISKIFAS